MPRPRPAPAIRRSPPATAPRAPASSATTGTTSRPPAPTRTSIAWRTRAQPGTDSTKYVVSDLHLRVPTLGERMKAWAPATKVYSISGKDRSAVAMGGHKVDQLWWWDQNANTFTTYAGRPAVPLVDRTNAAVAAQIAQAQPRARPARLLRAARPRDRRRRRQDRRRRPLRARCRRRPRLSRFAGI